MNERSRIRLILDGLEPFFILWWLVVTYRCITLEREVDAWEHLAKGTIETAERVDLACEDRIHNNRVEFTKICEEQCEKIHLVQDGSFSKALDSIGIVTFEKGPTVMATIVDGSVLFVDAGSLHP